MGPDPRYIYGSFQSEPRWRSFARTLKSELEFSHVGTFKHLRLYRRRSPVFYDFRVHKSTIFKTEQIAPVGIFSKCKKPSIVRRVDRIRIMIEYIIARKIVFVPCKIKWASFVYGSHRSFSGQRYTVKFGARERD
jgi:hypothetical protein